LSRRQTSISPLTLISLTSPFGDQFVGEFLCGAAFQRRRQFQAAVFAKRSRAKHRIPAIGEFGGHGVTLVSMKATTIEALTDASPGSLSDRGAGFATRL
jgi:hypothetical protein